MKNKKEFKEKLIDFIQKGTCAFTCINEIKNILKNQDYEELFENEEWKLNEGNYYVIRNDASIVCFNIPKKISNSFSIITTHSDTPALLLKPNGNYIKENYLKYNVMPYGGLLNYGFLDRVLSLAGRIIIKNCNNLERKIIDFKKPLLIIPSVAIHQNDNANSNLDLNMQIDLQPILGISDKKEDWNKILNNITEKEIIDYELFTYSLDNSYLIGKNKELFVSPRIDNLTSVFSGLQAFLNQKGEKLNVFCAFNSEEIGSLTTEGADSNFLIDTIKRISASLDIDVSTALSNSFIISSDNTHGVHPNHTEYADDTGKSYLNKGFSIIKETSSTTNSISSAMIKEICKKNKIKYQDTTSKNDISGGTTLSGLSLRHVSALSIDVGIPELAMHSSIEVCSINDIYELYKMMLAFYNTKIKIKKRNIIFL